MEHLSPIAIPKKALQQDMREKALPMDSSGTALGDERRDEFTDCLRLHQTTGDHHEVQEIQPEPHQGCSARTRTGKP